MSLAKKTTAKLYYVVYHDQGQMEIAVYTKEENAFKRALQENGVVIFGAWAMDKERIQEYIDAKAQKENSSGAIS